MMKPIKRSKTQSSRSFGTQIEQEALRWWIENRSPCRVLEQNYRVKCGEIDLILEELRGGVIDLVFVEIRARISSQALVGPIESIGFTKLSRIQRAMQIYFTNYRGSARNIRLDLLGWSAGKWTHIEGVW